MAKVDRVIEVLEGRIRRGDYALRTIPSDNLLADEVGVSRMTARKAVLHLMEKGLLVRQPNGRVAVKGAGSRRRRRSHSSDRLSHARRSVAGDPALAHRRWRWRRRGSRRASRTVPFYHWEDPAVLDASAKLDGVFLVPPAERMPPAIAGRLRAGPRSRGRPRCRPFRVRNSLDRSDSSFVGAGLARPLGRARSPQDRLPQYPAGGQRR